MVNRGGNHKFFAGQVNGRTDGRTDGRLDGRQNGQTKGRNPADSRRDGWIYSFRPLAASAAGNMKSADLVHFTTFTKFEATLRSVKGDN